MHSIRKTPVAWFNSLPPRDETEYDSEERPKLLLQIARVRVLYSKRTWQNGRFKILGKRHLRQTSRELIQDLTRTPCGLLMLLLTSTRMPLGQRSRAPRHLLHRDLQCACGLFMTVPCVLTPKVSRPASPITCFQFTKLCAPRLRALKRAGQWAQPSMTDLGLYFSGSK
jgi:hypothetical protein